MVMETVKVKDTGYADGFRIVNKDSVQPGDVVINASEGLSVGGLREAITAKGIDIPDDAKKADLKSLLDSAA